MELMEEILSRDNLQAAFKKVRSNKGAPGIDGITVCELAAHCKEHWPSIRDQILNESYSPSPVLKVEIPKPGGKGTRILGVPCTIDRLVQQAMVQVLTPIFDPEFSDSSFGFRPGRSAHHALQRVGQHLDKGFTWVVSIDLEKFFDKVNHDILMSRVARKVKDKKVLRLIRKFLNCGIMEHGVASPRSEGAVQGGPLSPLLSNIILDDLDKELEKRGHRFCRYADDTNVFVKSERSGKRVLDSLERFLWERLKLPINREKSVVTRPARHTFLGYTFYRYRKPRLRISDKSMRRLKDEIRGSHRRWRGLSLTTIIAELNLKLRGWIVYYRYADAGDPLRKLEAWILRRLRCIVWRQWKTSRTRLRELLRRDVSKSKAARAAWGRGGPWFSASTSAMNFALDHKFFESLGWLGISKLYRQYKSSIQFV